MGEFSLTHWLVIAVIGIVFFGPKRLPQLGASLGESIRGFKKALNDHHDTQDQQASSAQQQQPLRRETIIATDVTEASVDPLRQAAPVKDPTHS